MGKEGGRLTDSAPVSHVHLVAQLDLVGEVCRNAMLSPKGRVGADKLLPASAHLFGYEQVADVNELGDEVKDVAPENGKGVVGWEGVGRARQPSVAVDSPLVRLGTRFGNEHENEM